MNCLNSAFFIIVLVIGCTIQGKTQTILNGDFENNLASSDHWNPTPAEFDSLMPHAHAYNSYTYGIDIYDNLFSGHSTLPLPSSWGIGISSFNTDIEIVMLELSSPLVVGQQYELSYWVLIDADVYYYGLDSLHIGITDDTAHFGTHIHTMLPPPYFWHNEVIQFTATTPATYITAQMVDGGGGNTWTELDNFSLSIYTPTEKIEEKHPITVVPNPVTTTAYLKAENGLNEVEIMIYNAHGKLLQQLQKAHLTTTTIDLSNYPSGVYFVHLYSEEKNETLRLIKQ